MVSLLATQAELATITGPQDVVTLAGLDQDLYNRFAHQLGNPPSVRVLAMVPASVLQKTITGLRIPTGPADADGNIPHREPNVTEVIQMALVWRISRQAVGLTDIDPMVENQTSTSAVAPAPTPMASAPTPAASVPGGSGASPVKKAKISSVLDQTDETEIAPLSRAEMAKFYDNHREITGAEPLPEVEPTDLQISAMQEKVIVRDESPYGDFAVLTPFGRRTQKVMKAKAFSFQPDGSWKSVEVPGPPSYQAWISCFRVYRAILFMLRYPRTAAPSSGATPSGGVKTAQPMVVQPHSMERYFEAFRELCMEFPEAWHLLMTAEDRMRGERFDYLRRQLQRAHDQGKVPVDVQFDPNVPWDGVFQAAAQDHLFWDSNVRRPAVAFLARMGNQVQPALEPISEGAKASLQNIEAALGAKPEARSPGPKVKKRKKGLEEEDAPKRTKPAGKKSAIEDKVTNRSHPRKWGGMFHSTAEGKELCYAWCKGSTPDSCPEPCKNGRAHKCQICLGSHQNRECQKEPPKGKGKGTRK